jgi:hypothetical protein
VRARVGEGGYDSSHSPVGWYVGTYLLRFVEIGARGNHNPRRKFLAWENTVLVKACSIRQAYRKVAKIARVTQKPYRGGTEGRRVRWLFVGVTDLLPIYERLGDGAEIMWLERRPQTLKSLRALVKPESYLTKRLRNDG